MYNPIGSASIANANFHSLEIDIIRLILSRRRTLAPCPPDCAVCVERYLPAIARFTARGAPLELVLPSFPAKAPSAAKVLGRLPDKAEEVALRSVAAFCDAIAAIYPPGARFTICSDGRVFGDLVGVSDADVSEYTRHLRAMIDGLGLRPISVYTLDDAYPDLDPDLDLDCMRARLIEDHGIPVEEVRTQVTEG
jgi:pyoverdine/dityrosine biosynthesis protein Dit1